MMKSKEGVVWNEQQKKEQAMLTNNRKFTRFDVPLTIKFRPTYGATEYGSGEVKNISREGLGLEARNFNFFQYENLELNVKLPRSRTFVTLYGDVAWKKRTGKKSRIGIRLKMQEADAQNGVIEKILSSAGIPAERMNEGDAKEVSEGKKPAAGEEKIKMPGIVKQYNKDRTMCRVTFRIPAEAAPAAAHVTVAGDFNNWSTSDTPLTRLKSGDFKIVLNLEAGREYRFRYLIDGSRWENDWHADRYLPNEYGSDDSVVIV